MELANGPITPKADDILKKAKIDVIPDILANA
jgi:glutamate dehydrogenase/leucine dehydrogenase